MRVYEGSLGIRRGLLALALAALVAVLGFVAPSVAWADEAVARIGDTTYETLDEAIEVAESGDTIELLGDAETSGINLHKDLTIQAAEGLETKPTITFTNYGIAMAYGQSQGCSLTFKNVDVDMTDIGSTPVTGEWNWLSICVSKSTLTLDNVNMTMDGENAVGAYNESTGTYKTVHAIYFTGNSELNLINGTVLTIKNYDEDALEWDSGNSSYEVNITNSTYISDNNRSGFTGTFNATIDNSTVKVLNSVGNGSNGTYYTIKNNSYVEFDGSGTWGISAWRIDMTDSSTLVATDNGYSGVWTRVLNVDETCTLEVEGNGYVGSYQHDKVGDGTTTGAASNAGISFWGNGTYSSEIEEGASVTIQNNAGPGIATLQGVANLTIGSATITNNGSGDENGDHGAAYGGGICNIGTVSLGSDVVLYNNHASVAGDDIYFAPTSTLRTLSFGAVGSGWYLDGDPDCTDAIDGWYLDDADERWEAHAESYDDVYVVLYDVDGTVTVNETLALKAAHGIGSADATLGAAKVLEGADIADYTFTFELLDGEGNELQTAENGADGSVSFGTFEFSEVGTYKYQISEVNDGQDGIVYDETVYDVTVDVKWDGEGACFVAEVTVEGSDDGTATFTNTYETEETVTPGDDETTDGDGDATEEAASSDILPQTGDTVNIAAVVVVAVIAAGTAAISLRALLARRRG